MTLGEWMPRLYHHFLALYGDEDLASVATAATVNELLLEDDVGMLTPEGELVIDVQTAWEIGDRCTVRGKGRGTIQAFRHPQAQVMLDEGREFVMVPYEDLSDRESLRDQALARLDEAE